MSSSYSARKSGSLPHSGAMAVEDGQAVLGKYCGVYEKKMNDERIRKDDYLRYTIISNADYERIRKDDYLRYKIISNADGRTKQTRHIIIAAPPLGRHASS